MSDERFAEFTAQYVAAPEARLTLIKAGVPSTPAALTTYR
jgi:hypothetical protein